MLKLCYECGSEKDEDCYNSTGNTTGTKKSLVKTCKDCEVQYSDVRLDSVRTKSLNILHIDAFRNMRSLPSTTGYVYFVKESDRPYVLVGHTKNLNDELNSLRLHFYEDLVCLLALPGTPQDVGTIKEVFKEYYQHDNWLSYGSKLAVWFVRVKRKSFINMEDALELVNCKTRLREW